MLSAVSNEKYCIPGTIVFHIGSKSIGYILRSRLESTREKELKSCRDKNARHEP